MEERLGKDHPRLAYPLSYLAELDAANARHADAVLGLERAVRLSETSQTSEADRGQLELMLATALRYDGRVAEADTLRDEVMPRLQTLGAPGANAIAEAGRFRQRLNVTIGEP